MYLTEIQGSPAGSAPPLPAGDLDDLKEKVKDFIDFEAASQNKHTLKTKKLWEDAYANENKMIEKREELAKVFGFEYRPPS